MSAIAGTAHEIIVEFTCTAATGVRLPNLHFVYGEYIRPVPFKYKVSPAESREALAFGYRS